MWGGCLSNIHPTYLSYFQPLSTILGGCRMFTGFLQEKIISPIDSALYSQQHEPCGYCQGDAGSRPPYTESWRAALPSCETC